MKTMALLVTVGAALTLSPLTSSLDLPQSSPTTVPAEPAVRAVLAEQQAAWNRGDVNRFMQGYWNSPDLTFAGRSGITRGWQPVLERYRRKYPDTAAMGRLDFTILEIHALGNDAVLALGKWHLKRANDEPAGVFTLVFQRFPEGWRIVHDHTSADAKQ